MAFRFNFGNSQTSTEIKKTSDYSENFDDDKNLETVDCDFIQISDFKFKVESNKMNTMHVKNQEIKYVTKVHFSDPSCDLLNYANSDLLPGIYEGGFKVWECSIDLVQFLATENCIHSTDSVLELGCGAGLPGLYAYVSGASVTFQDYNAEVLKQITIPNAVLNTIDENAETTSNHCQFLYGDWRSILKKFYSLNESKVLYDVILTSETIYNKQNQLKLLDLMKSALKPKGVIYLASKVHYFGVGGGIIDFEQLLEADGTFDFSSVFKTTDGVERQILKLTFKGGKT